MGGGDVGPAMENIRSKTCHLPERALASENESGPHRSQNAMWHGDIRDKETDSSGNESVLNRSVNGLPDSF